MYLYHCLCIFCYHFPHFVVVGSCISLLSLVYHNKLSRTMRLFASMCVLLPTSFWAPSYVPHVHIVDHKDRWASTYVRLGQIGL